MSHFSISKHLLNLKELLISALLHLVWYSAWKSQGFKEEMDKKTPIVLGSILKSLRKT